MSTFSVYAIVNPFEKIYVGQTSDLARRILQHNDPENSLTLYTKKIKGPWKLFYSETFPTRAEAMKRERALKSSRARAFLREKLATKKLAQDHSSDIHSHSFIPG